MTNLTQKLGLGLGLSMATAGMAQAQLPGFTGNYTADLTCKPETNAKIDAILAAQAPYLRRAATTLAPGGSHPMCALALRYDQIVFGGVPTPLHPNEVAHIIVDLEDVPGQACSNAPGTKRSFIPLIHQNDPSFVSQSRFVFGYNAYDGYVIRNHVPSSTQWNASPVLPGTPADNQLFFTGTFHTRVALNGTGLAALPALAAALDAPVIGNALVPTPGKAWNQVLWNATAANVQSQNANMFWTSSMLSAPFAAANVAGLNSGTGAPFSVHFENTPFGASFAVGCTP